MPLELSQLYGLLDNKKASIHVGHLPAEVQEHLGSQTNLVHLSSPSLIHMMAEHKDLTLFDFLAIPEMIAKGLWIADRASACCISYLSAHDGKHYKGAVKAAAEGCEHYISTFHRMGPRQTKALLKRGPELRPHL